MKRLRMLVLLTAVSVAVITPLAYSAQKGEDDPPTLAWNKNIGGITLGMDITRVEYMYGPYRKVEQWKLPAVDTRYKNRTAISEQYVVDGHTIWVTFLGGEGKVRVIETASSYYRSKAGIGVGTRIPLGPCIKKNGYCEYRWSDFRYWECDGGLWIASAHGQMTVLYTKRGNVSAIQMGDQDIILPCY